MWLFAALRTSITEEKEHRLLQASGLELPISKHIHMESRPPANSTSLQVTPASLELDGAMAVSTRQDAVGPVAFRWAATVAGVVEAVLVVADALGLPAARAARRQRAVALPPAVRRTPACLLADARAIVRPTPVASAWPGTLDQLGQTVTKARQPARAAHPSLTGGDMYEGSRLVPLEIPYHRAVQLRENRISTAAASALWWHLGFASPALRPLAKMIY